MVPAVTPNVPNPASATCRSSRGWPSTGGSTPPSPSEEVRHFEVDLTGTGISYQSAGDSIAVHATNDPALVEGAADRPRSRCATMRSTAATSRWARC